MIGTFFWRLGVPLALLWYLGAVVLCFTDVVWRREDVVLLLLVVGPIGSAALALAGGVLGFVFAGFSLGVLQLNRRRRFGR
jgi:hypothetical protein